MQRTRCGLSRLHHNATRQQRSVFHIAYAGRAHCHRRELNRASQAPNIPRLVTRNAASLTNRYPNDDGDLLIRCRQYGLTSTADLDRESNFDTKSEGQSLLTDVSPYRQDLKLWDVLLDYRIRHHGSKGAAAIWRGMKYRGPKVSLESEDDLTTYIWRKLLSCAAEHNDLELTKRLCEQGGIAWTRPKLFAETISALLHAGRDFQVGVMCDLLKSKHRRGIADVLELYKVFQPQHRDELKAFCSVYKKVRPGKMYEFGVQHLFRKSRPKEAFLLHKFLISRGDFPSSFHEIEPFMKYLAKESEDPGPFLRSLSATGAVFSGQGRLIHEYESHKITSNVDKKLDPKRRDSGTPWANKVSDTFAAKAFATKALSFEFVLNTLRAFGLTEVGPQSIREIGLNASDLNTLSERLTRLDELGIDTGGGAYSRFIRRTCVARESALLQQALRTDMHHDVFEDAHLQQRLLVESLNKCAWPQVNLLLAMLNQGQVTHLSNSVKSALFESVIDDDLKARSFLTLLSNLTSTRTRLSSTIFHDLADHVIQRLQNTRKERLPPITYQRRAQFTAGVLQACTAVGARLTVSQWRMLIGHLGKSGSLRDVHDMTLWLAMWYHEQPDHVVPEDRPAERDMSVLTSMFDNKFQGAIVYWTLKDQFHKKSGRVLHPWHTTLRLLHHLQTDCGVPIRLSTIRKTIVSFVQGLGSQPAPLTRGRRLDSRSTDSRKLCFKLLTSMNEFWPSNVMAMRQERDVVIRHLTTEKTSQTNAVATANRLTARRALGRFSISEHTPPRHHQYAPTFVL